MTVSNHLSSSSFSIPAIVATTAVAVGVATWLLLLFRQGNNNKADKDNTIKGSAPLVAAPPPNATFCTLKYTGYSIRFTDTHAKNQHLQHNKDTTQKVSTTLVLVHGFGGCLETWEPLVPLLLERSPSTRVICLDLLGSGFSDKPVDTTVDYTFRGLGRVIVTDFVQTMGLAKLDDNNDDSKLVLVGHSAAGIVLAAASSVLGKSCRGLCLVAPGFYLVKPSIFSTLPALGKFMGRLLATKMPTMMRSSHLDPDRNIPPTTATAFAQQWKTRNATQALQAMITAAEPPYEQVLADIPSSTPLHIVWSQQDKVNPPAPAKVQAFLDKQLHEAPRFTHAVLSGSGHYLQHEVPQQLAREIDDFVQSLQS